LKEFHQIIDVGLDTVPAERDSDSAPLFAIACPQQV
jgi:hypothetical protein